MAFPCYYVGCADLVGSVCRKTREPSGVDGGSLRIGGTFSVKDEVSSKSRRIFRAEDSSNRQGFRFHFFLDKL